jgi:hypothetical protein
MSIAFFGSVYRNEGSTNIGIPNWSDSTSGLSNAAFFLGFVTEVDTNGDGIIDNAIWDGNGDGFLDFNFQDPYNSLERSDYVNSRDWVSPFKCLSLYTNGDYLLQDDNDTRIFYGALYAQRDTDVFSRGGQLFDMHSVTQTYLAEAVSYLNWQTSVKATGHMRYLQLGITFVSLTVSLTQAVVSLLLIVTTTLTVLMVQVRSVAVLIVMQRLIDCSLFVLHSSTSVLKVPKVRISISTMNKISLLVKTN